NHYEEIQVICLKKGDYDLPKNVHVYSLGKEAAHGPRSWKRLLYIARLWRYVWRLRRSYGAVLVLQNQEYPLSAGWLWLLLGKKVYLWRNHYMGNWITAMAIFFCTKVFYTSRHSYTAHFSKGVKMPVGID